MIVNPHIPTLSHAHVHLTPLLMNLYEHRGHTTHVGEGEVTEHRGHTTHTWGGGGNGTQGSHYTRGDGGR